MTDATPEQIRAADDLYDTVRTKVFRAEFREIYARLTPSPPAEPLAAVKAAISPLVYDGGSNMIDDVSTLTEEIAEAAVRALRPFSRRRRPQYEYYDKKRQNLISEHDCTFEDGTWWFGHGMECQYPALHGAPLAIEYIEATWLGHGLPTRNTPAGEIIAILKGERQ